MYAAYKCPNCGSDRTRKQSVEVSNKQKTGIGCGLGCLLLIVVLFFFPSVCAVAGVIGAGLGSLGMYLLSKFWWVIPIVLAIIIGVEVWKHLHWVCEACGHEWRPKPQDPPETPEQK